MDLNTTNHTFAASGVPTEASASSGWGLYILALLLCVATAAVFTNNQPAEDVKQQSEGALRDIGPPEDKRTDGTIAEVSAIEDPEPHQEQTHTKELDQPLKAQPTRPTDDNPGVSADAGERTLKRQLGGDDSENETRRSSSDCFSIDHGENTDLGHNLSVALESSAASKESLRVTYRVPTANRHLGQEERQSLKLSRNTSMIHLADLIVDHPEASIELIIEPEIPSLTHSDDVTLFEDVDIASITSGTRFRALKHRNQMPEQISRHLANFFHMQQLSKAVGQDQRKTFDELLDLARPTRIVLDVDPSELTLYPETNVLPVGALPLALAGNECFTADDPLPYLEIGSWLPISSMCGSRHHFAFTEWHILTLCIPYEGIMAPSGKLTGAQLLPALMWDPSYGFTTMMERWSRGQGRLCLLIEHARLAKNFRKIINELAHGMNGDAIEREEADHRLQLFQTHVFAMVKPEDGEPPQVKAVWKPQEENNHAD